MERQLRRQDPVSWYGTIDSWGGAIWLTALVVWTAAELGTWWMSGFLPPHIAGISGALFAWLGWLSFVVRWHVVYRGAPERASAELGIWTGLLGLTAGAAVVLAGGTGRSRYAVVLAAMFLVWTLQAYRWFNWNRRDTPTRGAAFLPWLAAVLLGGSWTTAWSPGRVPLLLGALGAWGLTLIQWRNHQPFRVKEAPQRAWFLGHLWRSLTLFYLWLAILVTVNVWLTSTVLSLLVWIWTVGLMAVTLLLEYQWSFLRRMEETDSD